MRFRLSLQESRTMFMPQNQDPPGTLSRSNNPMLEFYDEIYDLNFFVLHVSIFWRQIKHG